MFEELKGKRVKCVYKETDSGQAKVARGILKYIGDGFVTISLDDGMAAMIRIDYIIRLQEWSGYEYRR